MQHGEILTLALRQIDIATDSSYIGHPSTQNGSDHQSDFFLTEICHKKRQGKRTAWIHESVCPVQDPIFKECVPRGFKCTSPLWLQYQQFKFYNP